MPLTAASPARAWADRLRRWNRSARLLVFGLLGFAATATAQDELRVITFDEALQIALEQNIDLRISENQLELQGAQVSNARADFLPNLVISGGPAQRYGLTFDQTTADLVSQTSESFNLSASANITVFDGFANQANLRQARFDLDAADFSYDRIQQRVISEVALNFLQVLLDRQQIEIQAENLESQRQLLEQVQEFVAVGARPISEQYQQEAQVAQAELQLLNAERSYQLSQVNLISVLQLDPLGNYVFEAPEAAEVETVPREYDLSVLFRQAFDNRVDLKAQRARIDAAAQGIRLARSGLWPSLSFGVSGGSSYSSLNPLGDFEEQFVNNNRNGAIRLNFQIPIFNRLNTRTQIESAQIQYRNTRLDQEALQQQVALEVRQAYLDYLTDIKQLEVTEKQLIAAERALEAEQERYNVGASTLIEVQQLRGQYVQAANNRVTAIYQFLTQSRLLEFYTGTIDPTATSIFE